MFSVLPPPPESCLRHPRNMDFSSSSLVNYTFASVYMCIYKEGEGEARYNLFLDVAKIFRILFFLFLEISLTNNHFRRIVDSVSGSKKKE